MKTINDKLESGDYDMQGLKRLSAAVHGGYECKSWDKVQKEKLQKELIRFQDIYKSHASCGIRLYKNLLSEIEVDWIRERIGKE